MVFSVKLTKLDLSSKTRQKSRHEKEVTTPQKFK